LAEAFALGIGGGAALSCCPARKGGRLACWLASDAVVRGLLLRLLLQQYPGHQERASMFFAEKSRT